VELEHLVGRVGGVGVGVNVASVDDSLVGEVAIAIRGWLRDEDHSVGTEREEDQERVDDDDDDQRVKH
jgi:hypothetical protein